MMKIYKIFTLVASIGIVFGSFAQDQASSESSSGKKIGYGARVGGNLSYFTQEPIPIGPKFGFLAGGFITYKAVNFLTMQLEVLYMQQGGKEVSTANSSG